MLRASHSKALVNYKVMLMICSPAVRLAIEQQSQNINERFRQVILR